MMEGSLSLIELHGLDSSMLRRRMWRVKCRKNQKIFIYRYNKYAKDILINTFKKFQKKRSSPRLYDITMIRIILTVPRLRAI